MRSRKKRRCSLDSLGHKFPNIFAEGRSLYTQSEYCGFGEDVIKREGKAYRQWDPKRSKLAAAIVKRVSQIGMREGDTVLYLGASHGYTPTFVADIVGPKGTVFCLDIAPRVVRDLARHCAARPMMIPLLADANKHEQYSWRVSGCDVLFQDIASKDQVRIFTAACDRFLKSGGFGLLSLKARSVDVTASPMAVFKESLRQLEASGLVVVDQRTLEPLERDHALFVVKKK